MGQSESCSDWWGGMLNKSLIQFSVDGLGSVLSLLFGLRPNYGRGSDNNGLLYRYIIRLYR